MILILSIKNDPCTEGVINWLRASNVSFIRINPDDLLNVKKLGIYSDGDSIVFEVNNRQFDLSEITSFWYRRGDLTFADLSDMTEPHLNQYLQKELFVLQKFVYKRLENRFHINKRADNEVNKLQSLNIARGVGLHIPPSEILYDTYATSLINNESSLITKAFSNGSYKHHKNGKSYSIGAQTELVASRMKTTFPSFVQRAIPKKFELRIFYIMSEVYATAIFSQRNEQTKVDFRNYDRKNPNRVVPFTCPKELIEKIENFMEKSDLSCGSLDFIYSTDEKFYFLEVNPIGQFQQVSIPGNYYLDKLIAEKLANHG